ncbi:D-aminoacyl-tRNA deacylase [Natronogracilivirga saccharolytica]|uniref:D-aminoacyl-tRNA deacylase n=1 Tax=Natronogracilivirga saccharolytica TaxID=2812953 RepID=A0A8J7USJ9_9BACT|nr:D-aminoacyl-tRNA deacylase [Natronogracilivirga saccharolytica]MBP3191601.1 D-tyrosyl-tRNA(Tyr) deacylase [Natronogracilivirga saccharolytica]
MKAVVQRVSEAKVEVDGSVTGEIDKGLLVLAAVHEDDSMNEVTWVADKCRKLRIFEDEKGKMNKSVEDVGGEILLVSQFTLYGEVKKGTRPSFIASAGPEKAESLYNEMKSYLNTHLPGKIQSGVFAAKMNVSLVNDGPVTIIIER